MIFEPYEYERPLQLFLDPPGNPCRKYEQNKFARCPDDFGQRIPIEIVLRQQQPEGLTDKGIRHKKSRDKGQPNENMGPPTLHPQAQVLESFAMGSHYDPQQDKEDPSFQQK
jgi:hypothetical protein